MGKHLHSSSTLTINRDAIAQNWLHLRNMLKKGADCAAVVKADAYGLGATHIAPTLYAQGCRHFFVATIDEGIDLRTALPAQDAQIMILHGLCGANAQDLIAENLTPVLNTPDDINIWYRGAARTPCLVHLDTGMNRLGLGENDMLPADVLQKLNIRYVMSHLACADEPAHPKNEAQRENFENRVKALGFPARLSFANSSGIFLGDSFHYDLARPGCGLYGINPTPQKANPLQPIITLTARILQVRDIAKGETVGYGATYTADKIKKCATISTGYADGFFRSQSGGRGQARINNTLCPVIGRVSMDTIVIDISDIPGAVHVGENATLLDDVLTVDAVAKNCVTIGYEVLTALGARHEKVYI